MNSFNNERLGMEKRQIVRGTQLLLTLALTVFISSIGAAAGAPPAAAVVGAGVGCIGDCNGDGHVTVDEIITGVNIALGNVDVLTCENLSTNGQVTVYGILTAVNEALNGCPEGVTGTISGTAVKGPVASATVRAMVIGSNGAPGAQIGSAMTDDGGNFTMQVGNYSGPLMLEMTGGSFIDEATGTRMQMGATDMMTAAIPNMTADTPLNGIEITPLTSMAQRMAEHMSGGMTQANIMQTNSAVGMYFDVSDILGVHPMDPTASGAGGLANQDQKNYGMTMAAMSKYANMIGMPFTSGMITAMMDDATDGIMNGMMGGTRIGMGGMGGMMGGTMMQADAGTSGLATAMTSFMLSAQNRSGLTVQDMQSLMDKLAAANGVIQ
jgi:hypothetical protein